MALGLDINASRNKLEEESQTKVSGTKTGSQINSGSVDVGAVINSGRTDTSDAITYNTGRTDVQSTDQTTTTSGGMTSGQSSSTTGGSVNTSNTAARANTSNTTSTTTNSGRIDTSQVMLTQQAVDRLIQQMMEGTQGLQAVSSGQRQSGGYNTTAATLLTNDLLARVGGEVAVRGAQTVNVTGGSTSTTNSSTVENIGAINTVNTIGPSTTNNIFSQLTAGGTTRVQGTNVNTVGSSASGTSAVNVTGESMSENISIRGPSRTDIYEEEKKQVDTTAQKTENKVEVRSKISIICTHLHAIGLMDSKIYYASARSFVQYPDHVRQGYYFWAIPVLSRMVKHPESLEAKFYSWLLNSRCRGVTKINTRWYDRAVAFVTYNICAVLGKTVAATGKNNIIFHKGN